jgi:hypothetical protein
MRQTYPMPLLLALMFLVSAAAVGAQEAALEGTVTLRGGKALTGEIKVAQVGVLQGCGVGSLLPDLGFFRVKVGEQAVEVKAAELAVAEVEWGLANEADAQSWEIKRVTLIKRDGTTITGLPTWSVQATSVVVGAEPAIYAFPKAGMDFSADNLLAKIEIAGAMPAAVLPPVTPEPPEAPAPTVPPVTPPTTTETPAPAGVPPTTGTTGPTPPPVVTGTVQPTIGQGAMEVVVTCPHCGEKMLVRVNVNVAPLGTN